MDAVVTAMAVLPILSETMRRWLRLKRGSAGKIMMKDSLPCTQFHMVLYEVAAAHTTCYRNESKISDAGANDFGS